MGPENDFSKDVLHTAWRNSRALLQSRISGVLALGASLVVGAGLQYWLNGLSIDRQSIVHTIAYSLATAVSLFVARFFWHLILAPSEVIFAEVRSLLDQASVIPFPRDPNYAIWKRRQSYQANELSALLVGIDPGAGSNSDYRSMSQLVMESLRTGKLKYSDPRGDNIMHAPGYTPDIGVSIAKEIALEWAEENGFTKFIAPLR